MIKVKFIYAGYRLCKPISLQSFIFGLGLFTVLHSISLTKIMFIRECGKVIIICDLVSTLLSSDVMYSLSHCQAEVKVPTDAEQIN
jgi:hypothetical protein